MSWGAPDAENMGATGEESGIIIPVPAFDAFLEEWRAKIGGVPPAGVPAHVTLLYPFINPIACAPVIDEVRSFFASVEPFEFELSEIGWFGERVVFVRPKPAETFVELTKMLADRWTQCVPYGGKHAEPVPHLTLAIEGSEADMRAIGRAAEELLPLRCEATEAWLMAGSAKPPVWNVLDTFPFGPGETSPG